IAQLVPESLALPAGGCVAGALLATALPRRLVVSRSREDRDSASTEQTSGSSGPGWRAPAVQAGIVLALCGLGELLADEPVRPSAAGTTGNSLVSPAASPAAS